MCGVDEDAVDADRTQPLLLAVAVGGDVAFGERDFFLGRRIHLVGHREDVLDSFTILGVLTGQAAAWAARRVTPEGVARLRNLATDVDANWHFHREIHRAAHSRRLMAQIRQAVRVVPSNFLAMFPEHEHHSLEDHQALVSALADGDAEQARSIAERHVLDAGHSLASRLEQASV
jgi:DNA-binding GntR family transcriptional regulator